MVLEAAVPTIRASRDIVAVHEYQQLLDYLFMLGTVLIAAASQHAK